MYAVFMYNEDGELEQLSAWQYLKEDAFSLRDSKTYFSHVKKVVLKLED